MKVLLCAVCAAFVSPWPRPHRWRPCDCGQAQVTWLDPAAGRLHVRAHNLDRVRVIGLDNRMLQAALAGLRGVTPAADEQWRTTHGHLTASADGYLFHAARRNCWAVIIAPHESDDITWEQRHPCDDLLD